MLGNPFRRKVVLLLLCSVLVAPWVSAADARTYKLQNPLDLFSRALSLLQRVWSSNWGLSPASDAGIVMPPEDPPRATSNRGLSPASDASGVMPPEDPPRPGSAQTDDGDPKGGNGGSGKP